ncbi:MAG: hypothetical protein Q9193_000160 [Seirophora villosa]
MSLGPSLSRDPTLPHNVHHRAPGTYGAADPLPRGPLPPLHRDDMGVRGPNPLFPQDQLPSMRDVEYGTYPGLPPMSFLVGLNKFDARTRFIQARAAALPRETEAQHDQAFQQQWDEELRRNNAAFAQRIRAGTVAGVPPMHRLVGMSWDRARRVYIQARQTALPHATEDEHRHAFLEQWTEQMRQGKEADADARAAEATAQGAQAAHAAGRGQGIFLARPPRIDPAVTARAAEGTPQAARAAHAAGRGRGSFLARPPRIDPAVATRGLASFFVAPQAAEATARDVQAAYDAAEAEAAVEAAQAAHHAREAEAASEATQAAYAAGRGLDSFRARPLRGGGRPRGTPRSERGGGRPRGTPRSERGYRPLLSK